MARGTAPTITSAGPIDIPLHRTAFEPVDLEAIVRSVTSGVLVGDGPASTNLAAQARSYLGCAYAAPTTSGTHALELMMRALPLDSGDEVICPSFTFVSAANAVVLAGGTPVFADIDPETLNLDPGDAAQKLTCRTRAVVTAHYAGIAARLADLVRLAEQRSIALLEDAAHALGGRVAGRPLGTWGCAAALSFHATKNLVAGEGGMFVTSDPEVARRAEIIREKGTDRSRFVRGEVDKYTWQACGSSFLMADPLCALVSSQWRRIQSITSARRERFFRYHSGLAALEADGLIRQPRIPEDCEPAFHIYWILLENGAVRGKLSEHLREHGIEASSHFVPLHLSPFARERFGTRPGTLPVTEHAAACLLRLPLYPSLATSEQHRVIDAVRGFFGR